MALALTVRKDSDDYVLIEHAGERIRIGVNDSHATDDRKVVIILLADDDTGQAPHKGWHLLRKKLRERQDGT